VKAFLHRNTRRPKALSPSVPANRCRTGQQRPDERDRMGAGPGRYRSCDGCDGMWRAGRR